jgi:hypothetical protein
MLRTGLYRAILTLAVVAIGTGALAAQELSYPDYYVTYYANIGIAPHGSVHIVNPGTFDSYPSSAASAIGDLCAMIYVFNASEQMQECCGCLTTPDDLRTIPIANLTSNPVNGTPLTSGVIKLVSTEPNKVFYNPRTNVYTVGCDPTGTVSTYVSANFVPESELRAWATHIQATSSTTGQVTEEEFADSQLSTSEEDFLTSTCAGIIGSSGVGSGKGHCGCGSGS